MATKLDRGSSGARLAGITVMRRITVVATLLTLMALPTHVDAGTTERVPSLNLVTTGSFHFDGFLVHGHVRGKMSYHRLAVAGKGSFDVLKKTRLNHHEYDTISESTLVEHVPHYEFDSAGWTASASGTMPSRVLRGEYRSTREGPTWKEVWSDATVKVSLRWRGIGTPTVTPSMGASCFYSPVIRCVPHPTLTRRGPAHVSGWIDFGGIGMRVHIPDGKIGWMVEELPALCPPGSMGAASSTISCR